MLFFFTKQFKNKIVTVLTFTKKTPCIVTSVHTFTPEFRVKININYNSDNYT